MQPIGAESNDPHVVAVVLNWNRLDDTLACIASIDASEWPQLTILVVDNGSDEEIEGPLKARFCDVLFVRNPTNLGFSGGMNVGMRRALTLGADYVLLLNNDVVVDRGMVRELVRVARERPDAGIVGPLAFFRDAPAVVASAGLRCDLRHAYQGGPLAKGERDYGQFDGVMEVDVPSGAAMLVHSSVIHEVGMLDEDLYLYIEDVDWAFRMRPFGKRSYTALRARLWHGGGSSSGGEHSPQAAYYHARNIFVVTARHMPLHGLRKALRHGEILAVVLLAALRSRRPRASSVAVLTGWRDYLRGRLGPAPRTF